MSSDPKPEKPLPSAEEINAYLEASAARTKLRLPIAKVVIPPAGAVPSDAARPAPAPPKPKALPTTQAGSPATPRAAPSAPGEGSEWRPFDADDKS